MKRYPFAIGLIAFALALPLAASENEKPAEKARPADNSPEAKADPKAARKISTDREQTESPLVRAARLARESRAKGRKAAVSISDDDVRASTGKLTVGNYDGPATDASGGEAAGDILRRMESDRDRAAKEAVAAARRVSELEEELQRLERAAALLEDDYYEHSDSTDEADGLQAAYDQARQTLQAKREELARARAELEQKRLAASNVVTP